jgi:hypothetical protein
MMDDERQLTDKQRLAIYREKGESSMRRLSERERQRRENESPPRCNMPGWVPDDQQKPAVRNI